MSRNEETAEVIRRFHELYYWGSGGAPPQKRIHFLGVETVKCPLDLWIYQEILHRTQPEVIVECGVHCGGTTLYLACLCDIIGKGAVVACDLSLQLVADRVRAHPRITLLEGGSTRADNFDAIATRCHGRRTMVILDSDHAESHVLEELRRYGPLVTPGCYLICEDTNINGHPVYPDFGPGPSEAVARFLAETDGWQVDQECEKLLLSFNPAGYLLRTGAPSPPPAARNASLASVIVPCHNQLEYTKACITSLAQFTRRDWELVTIDNGSTDGTREYLNQLRASLPVPVTVIGNAENRGFPAACNQGLEAARGAYLVLLNNDVVVTEGWLDQLVALADSDPMIGLAGPMTNYASPPQLVESVPYTDLDAMHRFASRWRSEHRGQWLTCPKLSGFCLLMKRAVYERLGGLDEQFGLGLLDDDDFAERARRAGYQLAVAHDLFVHHFGSRTFAELNVNDRALLAENRARFANKWGEDVANRLKPVDVTPWRQGRDAPRARVSLTMIVRNEESNLPACLESVQGVFDEIVIVDTGSTDRTREIALEFGARVFDFIWVDDFAAARNAALARATGDYAFWLDADDRIEPSERPKLEHLLAGLRGDDPAAFVVRCSCDPDENGGGGATVVDHMRLFPLREDVRWTYRVHEQILPSLRSADIPVRWTDLMVRHTGYADAALRARKLERDVAILRADLEDKPGDPFVLFNLGSIAIEREAWSEALGYLEESLARSAPDDSITRKLFALIARCHQGLGATDAALEACQRGLALDPEDAELWFRRAVVHRQRDEPGDAEACWQRIIGLRRPEKFSSVDMGIYGHLTRRNLAVLAEQRRDGPEAIAQWGAVLAECPGDVEATAQLERLRAPRSEPVS